MKGNPNMKKITAVFQLIVLIVAMTELVANAQDACRDIIPLGFYNKTQTANSGNFTQDVKNWLVSDYFREYMNRSGADFGVKVPIDGLPVGFNLGTDDASYQRLRAFINQGNTSYINQSFANFVSSQVVDPSVVNAWSECMAARAEQVGLVGLVDGETENTFFMRIRWYPSLGVNTARISNIWVSGATYDVLRIGDSIGSNWVSIPFVRNGNNSVSISINTENNIGSIIKMLPPPGVPKSNRQLCLEGDEVGCVKHKNDLLSKCGVAPSPTSSYQTITAYQSCRHIAQCYENRVMALMQSINACATNGNTSQQCLETKSRLVFVDPAVCDNISSRPPIH
jgi:hypothetical protein